MDLGRMFRLRRCAFSRAVHVCSGKCTGCRSGYLRGERRGSVLGVEQRRRLAFAWGADGLRPARTFAGLGTRCGFP
jgi:hypothetical protein